VPPAASQLASSSTMPITRLDERSIRGGASRLWSIVAVVIELLLLFPGSLEEDEDEGKVENEDDRSFVKSLSPSPL
jgi:hypothetical protein